MPATAIWALAAKEPSDIDDLDGASATVARVLRLGGFFALRWRASKTRSCASNVITVTDGTKIRSWPICVRTCRR